MQFEAGDLRFQLTDWIRTFVKDLFSSSTYRETPMPPKRLKFNSAFRLCYSLQLLPCVNERHQLVDVLVDMPSSQQRSRSRGVAARDRGERTGFLRKAWFPLSCVAAIFVIASYCLYLLSLGFQDEETGQSYNLYFPTNVDDIRHLSNILIQIKTSHPIRVLLIFTAGYIYKQSFAIPGSVVMNVLGGALYGPLWGFLLTCTLTAIGATNCYLLSRCFLKSLIQYLFPEKVNSFHEKIEENRDSLFFFLLFLRLFPMSPNWAMNMIAPIVGVPIHVFFLSIFIGLMPYNFFCAQTGSVLSQISSIEDIFTLRILLTMMFAALVTLVPVFIIKRMHTAKQD